MTKHEFEKFIKNRLMADGFSNVKVSVSLFGTHADVTARDSRGKKRRIKAELIKRRGEELVKLDTIDQDWIDELEMLDAILDDE